MGISQSRGVGSVVEGTPTIWGSILGVLYVSMLLTEGTPTIWGSILGVLHVKNPIETLNNPEGPCTS